MQKILGFAAQKSGGKNTACNFILGMEMQSLGLIDDFNIAQDGKLLVHEPGQPSNEYVIIDVFGDNPDLMAFLEEKVYPYVKIYSFADALKQLCIDLLGLDRKLVYGTDADKNTLTHIKWRDCPGVLDNLSWEIQPSWWLDNGFVNYDPTKMHENMTVREVLQHVGTNVFRRMYEPVWVNSCLNRIQQEGSQFALICDVRFVNEVEAIQKIGGKVIHLTRKPFAHLDKHASETGLDACQNFDWILDNANMSIDESSRALYHKLKEWNYLEYEIQFEETVQ